MENLPYIEELPASTWATKEQMQQENARLRSEIIKLQAENEALRKDAERYRVLRDSEYQLHEDDPCVSDSFFNSYYGIDLDAAVDELKARFDAASEQAKGGV